MLGQELRRALADHANSEAVDDALERQLLRIFNLVENVLRRLVGEALQTQQILLGEVVDVSDVLDQAAIDELHDQRFAHAVNIHHTARREVQNRAEQFRGTVCIDAAVVDFALSAHDFRPTHGALLGHFDISVAARMILIVDDLRDLGITSPPRSTCTQSPIFTPSRSISSMLCSVALRTVVPPIGTGASSATGVSFAGAAHLPANVFQLGDSSARRIFVSNRPARSFAGEAEFILQAQCDRPSPRCRQSRKAANPASPSHSWMKAQTSSIECTSLRFG